MFERISQIMWLTMWVSVALSLALVALLVASFTRRLHDCGKPGWIATAAAAMQVVAIIMTIATMDDAIRMVVLAQTGDLEAVEQMQARFLFQGLLGWVPMALVVVFGVWPSTPRDNRYGPAPVAD